MLTDLAFDKFWWKKNVFDDAEKKYYEKLAKDVRKTKLTQDSLPKTSLAGEIAKTRQYLKSSLECMDQTVNGATAATVAQLATTIQNLEITVKNLCNRLDALEKQREVQGGKPCASKGKTPQKSSQEDEDIDLFGSDSEETEDAKTLREKRLAENAAKKSKKPAPVAKSNIILDIKPWSDETDMKKMEEAVRAIQMDGLLWGASKLAPVAFKIFKLQISCVVEDEKVSVDALTETLEGIEEYVQSVDIAAFNKV